MCKKCKNQHRSHLSDEWGIGVNAHGSPLFSFQPNNHVVVKYNRNFLDLINYKAMITISWIIYYNVFDAKKFINVVCGVAMQLKLNDYLEIK